MTKTTGQIEERPQLGVGMILIAWFLFSLVDTSAKWLVIFGLPVIQLAFMRYFGHFVISTFLMAKTPGVMGQLQTPYLWTVLFRSFLLVSATCLNFFTLRYLSLPVVSSIMFSSPIILCAISGPLLGEKVGPWRWFAIVLGFVGVMFVIRPWGESFHWAMVLNCYNAISIALYSILTRKLAGKVSTDVMQFYTGVLGTFAILPFAWVAWANPETTLNWALLIGMGIFAWAGHQLLTTAHRFATASLLMPYTYSFMIYLTIFSYLVFDDLPDLWTFVGAGIIIVSGLMIWWRERRI